MKKYFLEAISKTKKLAITEEEYFWIIQNCEDLPEGLVWARTSIGAPSDKYLIYVKKPTEPKFSNTFLETDSNLQNIAVNTEHFTQDLVKL